MAKLEYLRSAGVASATTLVASVRPVLLLVLLAGTMPASAISAIGLGSSIGAIATVLATGLMVSAMRAVLPMRMPGDRGPERARAGLAAEFDHARRASVLLFAVYLAILAVIVVPGGFGPLAAYWLGLGLAIVIDPISSVCLGAFQGLGRDRQNLLGVTVALLCTVAAAAVLPRLIDDTTLVAALIGAVASATALGGVVIRSAQLRRAGVLGRASVRPSIIAEAFLPGSIRPLVQRAGASVDGLVFVTVFAYAVFVAGTHSAEAGAATAIAVSTARAIIVPLKQFGLIGARHVLSGTTTLKQVQLHTFAVLVLVAAAVIGFRAVQGAGSGMSWVLIALICAQLLIEPWAGVLYSFRKVERADGAGLPALFGAYGLIAVPGLTVLWFTGSAVPEIVWAVLLAARLAFALGLAIRGRGPIAVAEPGGGPTPAGGSTPQA